MLQSLHNTASGRIFMLGTGPSLLEQTHELLALREEPTFCTNRLGLWEWLPFTPRYYGVSKPDMIKDVGLQGSTTQHFILWPADLGILGWQWVPRIKSRLRTLRHAPFQGFGDGFERMGSAMAAPITWLQLAAWMGYRQFYILGCELSDGYVFGGRQRTPQAVRNEPRILECAQIAKQAIEEAGGSLVDCTPDGKLHSVLEYQPLAEVLRAN